VVVSGSDITDANDSELTALRRSTIGFVFENFNLIGSLTAEQNVAMLAALVDVSVAFRTGTWTAVMESPTTIETESVKSGPQLLRVR
jgi:ABC-type lipoprotein export system ATPase subunit